MEKAAPAHVQLLLDAPDAPVMLCGAAGRIQQVLINLVQNAVDATAHHPAPRVSVRLTEADGWATVTVADNGPGLSPEVQQRLFEPFSPPNQWAKAPAGPVDQLWHCRAARRPTAGG